MRSLSKAGLLLGTTAALLLAGAGAASADSNAYGAAFNSPGVLSGNVIQVPIDIPVNVCGDSVNVVGALNPAFGNRCSNGGDDHGYQSHHGYHVSDWQHQGWSEPSRDQHDGPDYDSHN
jgi:hypothetical protein